MASNQMKDNREPGGYDPTSQTSTLITHFQTKHSTSNTEIAIDIGNS